MADGAIWALRSRSASDTATGARQTEGSIAALKRIARQKATRLRLSRPTAWLPSLSVSASLRARRKTPTREVSSIASTRRTERALRSAETAAAWARKQGFMPCLSMPSGIYSRRASAAGATPSSSSAAFLLMASNGSTTARHIAAISIRAEGSTEQT